jgi:enoyl-CoA hydratase/carnithine racemase
MIAVVNPSPERSRAMIRKETHGRVAVIRIERPAKRNAIDRVTTAELDDALNDLQDNPGYWVGVLTGTADVFCAGTDIMSGPGGPTQRGGEYGVIRRKHTKPLIAAVEGLALGGGFEIAMSCDLVVASRTAEFGLPETRRGLVANSGALLRAMRCLPVNLARELLITGARLDAQRAHEIGFVNRLAEPGHAVPVALKLAEEICASSPASVRSTLQALEEQWVAADAVGWEATARAVERIQAGPDVKEGLAAFAEKREPHWADPGSGPVGGDLRGVFSG